MAMTPATPILIPANVSRERSLRLVTSRYALRSSVDIAIILCLSVNSAMTRKNKAPSNRMRLEDPRERRVQGVGVGVGVARFALFCAARAGGEAVIIVCADRFPSLLGWPITTT